jgi:hypothetical protein
LLTLWDLILRPIKDVFIRPEAKDIAPTLPTSPTPSNPPAPKLVAPPRSLRVGPAPSTAPRAAIETKPAARAPRAPRKRRPTADERYEEIVRMMLARYSVKVRRWRSSMSGVAWELTYKDGTVTRHLESPRPKSPLSMAIFLHEIGHHAIGFNRYKPRCLEEYHAWAFSIRTMEERGLNITDRVRDRMFKSLRYAVRKARRRGLKELPVELLPYSG